MCELTLSEVWVYSPSVVELQTYIGVFMRVNAQGRQSWNAPLCIDVCVVVTILEVNETKI